MPDTRRRRTPGLRREEVAELAQIGVTWYTWLEQGRYVRASHAALERVAGALQLIPDEREHLLALADYESVRKLSESDAVISPGLQTVFDSLTSPAFIRGPCGEIRAWNDAATAVFGNPFSRPKRDRNSVLMMFANPYLRRIHLDWEVQAREFLAMFRTDYDRMVAEREQYDDLVCRASEHSPEFGRWWLQHDVHHW